MLYGRKDRFVLHDSHKKFACATKESAAESFRARKKAQIRIYEQLLQFAKSALAYMPDGVGE